MGNLSWPLLTRRANKGSPRPFHGIKYLGAIYLLRPLSPPSAPPLLLPSSIFLSALLFSSGRRRPRWDFSSAKERSFSRRKSFWTCKYERNPNSINFIDFKPWWLNLWIFLFFSTLRYVYIVLYVT